MKIGKTIQAIGIANACSNIRKVLVVCPASLKLNWKREWTKWDTKNLSIEVVQPGKKSFPSADVVVINYDVLKKYREDLRSASWDLAIFDEAHMLKEMKTGRTKEVFGQKRNGAFSPIPAQRYLFLTGTPIVNRPKELWPLLQALDPEGIGKNFMAYALRYCGAFKHKFGWDFSGATHLDELQEILRSKLMVRRLKADVLKELPAKRRQVLVLESKGLEDLLEKEKKAYDEYSKFLADGDFETPAFADMSEVRKAVAVAKIPFIVEHIQEVLEEQDKVCVFVHHYEVVDALRAAFGGSAVGIDGRSKNEDRQAAVDRFQTDPNCKVFIGTIRAAGIGITLTASSTVIFGELDWVPGNVSQAEDRCHRIGQLDTVFVRHLVLEGSLDERMAQIIVEKQSVIDKALDVTPESSEFPRFKVMDVIPPSPSEHIPGTIERIWVTKEELENKFNYPIEKEFNTERYEKLQRSFTDEQEQAVLRGLRILAGTCDGAEELDGRGFNKRDTCFGKMLAQKTYLTEKTFAIGQKMLKLYHRQIPADVLISAGVKEKVWESKPS